MPYIGRDTDKLSNIEVLDNITFDGSSSYTLQKGGSNFTPSSANTLLLSIDGVVQAGNFTVSGSTIDFGTAVAATSTCDFILHYGIGLITTPSDGTVSTAKLADSSVTTAKLNDASVSLAKLTATGTKDSTTFLRGDNTFAEAGGGSYDLLATTTITTGVSSVSFDGYFSSTYHRYLVTFDNLMFSTDDLHLYIRVRQSNADRTDTDGYRNMGLTNYVEFDGGTNGNGELHFGSIENRGRITRATVENTDVYGGISGQLNIIDPLQTSHDKVIFTEFCHVWTNDNSGNFQSQGRGLVRYRANSNALSGISFVADSGTYDGGTIKLYGMK